VSHADAFRQLPSVDELARSLAPLEARFPRALIVNACRGALQQARTQLRGGAEAPGDLAGRVRAALEALEGPSLRRVINATGVILHTNLGRAPLPRFETPSGYTNLEYDLVAGTRGRRDTHTAAPLAALLGAPSIVVNNGAAAIFLALHELAGGGEVIVSRGELIEIGDGFRIPEIMQHSGARLVEVGATNKTRIEDYKAAIGPETRLLLRVHPSNFRMEGFTGRPALEELVALGHDANIPVYEDLGSGCLLDLTPYGITEPTAQASLRAGVDLISCSGDKLLGGPQAGILAGRADLVARLRRNPLFRALRVDKLTIAALEVTLRDLLLEQWDELPVLRMLRLSAAELKRRAESFVERQGLAAARVVEGSSLVGGGSTPLQHLPAWLVAFEGDTVALERHLRQGTPPVIARIEDERLVVDLRTVAPDEEDELARALHAALGACE
jgi:L-seryl-tRNA(Ser) seleniumtransferase